MGKAKLASMWGAKKEEDDDGAGPAAKGPGAGKGGRGGAGAGRGGGDDSDAGSPRSSMDGYSDILLGDDPRGGGWGAKGAKGGGAKGRPSAAAMGAAQRASMTRRAAGPAGGGKNDINELD